VCSVRARNGDDQRIVAERGRNRAPGGQVGQRVGPADGEEASLRGEPSVAAAAHPVVGVGQCNATQAMQAGKLDGALDCRVGVQVAGTEMSVPALDGGSTGDAGGLGGEVDAAVGDHLHEAWKSVEAVAVDAVACGLGEEARAECGAFSMQTEVQHRAVKRVVEVGVGNSQHGSVQSRAVSPQLLSRENY